MNMGTFEAMDQKEMMEVNGGKVSMYDVGVVCSAASMYIGVCCAATPVGAAIAVVGAVGFFASEYASEPAYKKRHKR